MVAFTHSNKLLRMSSVYKPVLALNAHLENREQTRIHPPSWILVTLSNYLFELLKYLESQGQLTSTGLLILTNTVILLMENTRVLLVQ